MLDLAARTIVVTLAGSRAHGTARGDSDLDLRGVAIAPLPLRLSLSKSFEQYEGPLEGGLGELVLPRLRSLRATGRGQAIESVIYDVGKFLRLCADANPNALEILFADPQDWLYETPAWRRLYGARHRFLTRKIQQTYLGYALAQLRRIRTHRSWLLHPPARKPTRGDFGLPEAAPLGRDDQHRIEQAIAEKLRSYGLENLDLPQAARIAVQERLRAFWSDALQSSEAELESRLCAVATRALALPPDVVATLNAEKRYRAALRHWESYRTWKAQRNPARARLERRHGYDTKHAMHLVRLMRMGVEVLSTGDVQVRRSDAGELLAIREGALSFDELLAEAERLEERMKAAVRTTDLPADVDRAFVDALAFELMSEAG